MKAASNWSLPRAGRRVACANIELRYSRGGNADRIFCRPSCSVSSTTHPLSHPQPFVVHEYIFFPQRIAGANDFEIQPSVAQCFSVARYIRKTPRCTFRPTFLLSLQSSLRRGGRISNSAAGKGRGGGGWGVVGGHDGEPFCQTSKVISRN